MTIPPFFRAVIFLAAAYTAFPASVHADSIGDGWLNRICSTLLLPASTSTVPTEHRFQPLIHGDVDFEKSVLLEDRAVKNQGAYGCCWISATHANYERSLYSQFGREIPLSDDYLVLVSFFYRIEEGIHHGAPVIEGGWSSAGDWLVNHVGLVPEAVWKPKVDLRNPESKEGKKIVAYLNEQIALFQSEIAVLKQTVTPVDKLEKMRLAWDRAEATKSRLYRYLRDHVGNPPSKFEIDGTPYTPHSFARAVLPDIDNHFVIEITPEEPRIPRKLKPISHTVSEAPPLPTPKTELGLFSVFPELAQRLPRTKSKISKSFPDELDPTRYRLFTRSRQKNFDSIRTPLSEIHRLLGVRLEMGERIHVSTPMVKKFYNSQTGVMSIAGHGFTLKDAKESDIVGGHAMLITGVYRKKSGEVLGYRLQNSWGNDRGQLGYYYMDKDYFDTFVNSVTFTKKPDPKAPKSAPKTASRS
jgi:aminopeptidase C